ncbi:hypothetical protein D9M71_287060 [compost metagenome]
MLQLLVGLAQLFLLELQFLGEQLRLLEQLLGAHVGFDGVEHDADRLGELVQEHLVDGAVGRERGHLDDRLDLGLEEDREHHDVQRGGGAQARGDRHVAAGHIGEQDSPLVIGALADQAFAEPPFIVHIDVFLVGVGGQQLELRRLLLAFGHQVEHPVGGVDQRREFRKHQPGNRRQVTLPLQQAGEFGQVGLEPDLLCVLPRRFTQVADHLVDVVLQLRHFALGFHLYAAGQVAFGHCGGHVGDRTHLVGQVRREAVDVVG